MTQISFIVPAHNEEQGLAATLESIHRAAQALGLSHELLVVNDSSSDRTGEIARLAGARVQEVSFRQISATRHAGAVASRGQLLFFVDADTLVNPEVVGAAISAMEGGAQGGGCMFRFDGHPPLSVQLFQKALQLLCRPFGLSSGCFLFCTRAAYDACGGFNLNLFATEEFDFALRIRRLGRFAVLPQLVTTSGRKLRTHGFWDFAKMLLQLIRLGPRALRSREGLDIWYRRRVEPPQG